MKYLNFDGLVLFTEKIKEYINKLINTIPSFVEITYNDLVDLKSESKLIPGQQYRIIDYKTTTKQDNTESAGHDFDIIVTADSANTLNEVARAIQHDGDTYFSGQSLESWKIWYCLDNDNTRYNWADPDNGKGVIYRMIDEFNNDCPYDFKNIKFLKDSIEVYTFGSDCHDNTILTNYNIEKTSYTLNFITLGNSCYSNSFGYNCYNNTLGNSCDYNILSNDCNNNTFSNSCKYNTLGNDCIYNSFGENSWYNRLGNTCEENSFGESSSSNIFGNSCSSNIVSKSAWYNNLGNSCKYNSFGDSSSSNRLSESCWYNVFGESSKYNSFGEASSNNTFGKSCQYNSLGNNCKYNTFGDSCSSNSFGNSCSNNSFGYNNSGNSFCNHCEYNSFGTDCYSNSFGHVCSNNNFGNHCKYNNFGVQCKYNNFGDSKTNLNSYYRYIIIDNGNSYINLNCTSTTSSSKYYQNVRIGLGVNNTSTYKTISDSNVGQAYQTLYKPTNSKELNA